MFCTVKLKFWLLACREHTHSHKNVPDHLQSIAACLFLSKGLDATMLDPLRDSWECCSTSPHSFYLEGIDLLIENFLLLSDFLYAPRHTSLLLQFLQGELLRACRIEENVCWTHASGGTRMLLPPYWYIIFWYGWQELSIQSTMKWSKMYHS